MRGTLRGRRGRAFPGRLTPEPGSAGEPERQPCRSPDNGGRTWRPSAQRRSGQERGVRSGQLDVGHELPRPSGPVKHHPTAGERESQGPGCAGRALQPRAPPPSAYAELGRPRGRDLDPGGRDGTGAQRLVTGLDRLPHAGPFPARAVAARPRSVARIVSIGGSGHGSFTRRLDGDPERGARMRLVWPRPGLPPARFAWVTRVAGQPAPTRPGTDRSRASGRAPPAPRRWSPRIAPGFAGILT